MTVARILANKGRSVVTTGPERTLQEVSVELMRHRIGALVVVDANDDIVGLEHCPIKLHRNRMRRSSSCTLGA